MARGMQQLITAGLAFILLGGVASPIMVQTDVARAATTTRAAEQTYHLGAIEIPYTEVIKDGKITKLYQFKKAAGDTTDPHTLTIDQLNDSDYMNSFIAANHNDIYAQSITTYFDQLFGQTLTLDPNESVLDYFFATGINDPEVTPAEYLDSISFNTYLQTWWLKNTAQLQLDQGDEPSIHQLFNSMSADYTATIHPKLVKLAETNDALADSLEQLDTMFSSYDKFTSIIPALTGSYYPAAVSFTHTASLSLAEQAALNPKTSEAETLRAWNQPMKTYLTKQADGTYQLDGMLLFFMFMVLSADDTVLQPTPDPTPTPTPETSQPVTVRYVDENGHALAPEKTLTGALGASYQSEAQTIDGYALTKTPTNAAGTFTGSAQTVTYVYGAKVLTGGDGDLITTAPKGSVIYATKKVGLYRHATFTQKTRKQWYVKKARTNRPMFVVTGYATSKNGVKRYHVKDVNHHSKTAGQTGYITAKANYTASVYYAKAHKTVTVINPAGINAYGQKNLTHKRTHYRQGQVLRVKKIVHHNLTTRFVLSNGQYITANKKLVQAGHVKMPKRVQAKTALNRYTNAALTQRNRHYTKQSHATFTVRGWRYSHANNFSKTDTLRYQVAGGYITGNRHFVTVLN